jgi:hypothetical protein
MSTATAARSSGHLVLDDATRAAIAAVTAQQGCCWLCGDPVHQVPRGDEWAWAGPDGKTTGIDADLRPLYAGGSDPYAHLSLLAERMGAAMTARGGPRGTRASLTLLYWAAAREYSALKVRLETGGTFHQHQVHASRGPGNRGPLPYHCAGPMRLTPSGWACRQCMHRQGTASSLEYV